MYFQQAVSFAVIDSSDVHEDGSHPSYVLTTGVSSFAVKRMPLGCNPKGISSC